MVKDVKTSGAEPAEVTETEFISPDSQEVVAEAVATSPVIDEAGDQRPQVISFVKTLPTDTRHSGECAVKVNTAKLHVCTWPNSDRGRAAMARAEAQMIPPGAVDEDGEQIILNPEVCSVVVVAGVGPVLAYQADVIGVSSVEAFEQIVARMAAVGKAAATPPPAPTMIVRPKPGGAPVGFDNTTVYASEEALRPQTGG